MSYRKIPFGLAQWLADEPARPAPGTLPITHRCELCGRGYHAAARHGKDDDVRCIDVRCSGGRILPREEVEARANGKNKEKAHA